MFKEWKKFRGWTVAEYFMKNPTTKIHVKGMSKKLGISPRTSETYLKDYEKSGLLKMEKIGNIHLYSLENENPVVKALKRFYIISGVMESGLIESIKDRIFAAAIYGSCSSGEYDEKSDIDILIIADRDIPATDIRKHESIIGKEIGITRLGIAEWKRKKESRDLFSQSVIKNHIIISGERI